MTNVTTHVGYKNPYRYRGYHYDSETQLYYLQSRYYNPSLERFINADVIIGIQGGLLSHNMFSYCVNNPVNLYDPDGDIPVANVVGALIGAGLGGLLGKAVADYYGLSGVKRYMVISGFTVGGAIIGLFAGQLLID